MQKKFSYGKSGKIVRDKILEKIKEVHPEASTKHKFLTGSELQIALMNKFAEEADELVNYTNRENLITEMGDVLDVITALQESHKISDLELAKSRAKKNESRGSFKKGLFVEWVECEPGYLFDYCLANPEKYPELPAKHKKNT